MLYVKVHNEKKKKKDLELGLEFKSHFIDNKLVLPFKVVYTFEEDQLFGYIQRILV